MGRLIYSMMVSLDGFAEDAEGRLGWGAVDETIEPAQGGAVLRSSRVSVGPISDDQERGVRFHGVFARFHDAIRSDVEAD